MGVMDEEQALSSQMMSESQASEGQGGVNLFSPACAPHQAGTALKTPALPLPSLPLHPQLQTTDNITASSFPNVHRTHGPRHCNTI